MVNGRPPESKGPILTAMKQITVFILLLFISLICADEVETEVLEEEEKEEVKEYEEEVKEFEEDVKEYEEEVQEYGNDVLLEAMSNYKEMQRMTSAREDLLTEAVVALTKILERKDENHRSCAAQRCIDDELAKLIIQQEKKNKAIIYTLNVMRGEVLQERMKELPATLEKIQKPLYDLTLRLTTMEQRSKTMEENLLQLQAHLERIAIATTERAKEEVTTTTPQSTGTAADKTTTATTETPPGKCRPPYRLTGVECLHLSETQMSWQEAREACQAQDGDLYIPAQRELFAVHRRRTLLYMRQLSYLYSLGLNAASDFWLGAKERDTDHKLVWLTGETVAQETDEDVDPDVEKCLAVDINQDGILVPVRADCSCSYRALCLQNSCLKDEI